MEGVYDLLLVGVQLHHVVDVVRLVQGSQWEIVARQEMVTASCCPCWPSRGCCLRTRRWGSAHGMTCVTAIGLEVFSGRGFFIKFELCVTANFCSLFSIVFSLSEADAA